jgi:hypothetical protein
MEEGVSNENLSHYLLSYLEKAFLNMKQAVQVSVIFLRFPICILALL